MSEANPPECREAPTLVKTLRFLYRVCERLQLLLRVQRPPAGVCGQTSAPRSLRLGGLDVGQTAANRADFAAGALAEAGQAEPVAAGAGALQT